jgi:3-hydroxyisobutyrate dehydrogenase-like beta-hydroxyacid dehydrogenase
LDVIRRSVPDAPGLEAFTVVCDGLAAFFESQQEDAERDKLRQAKNLPAPRFTNVSIAKMRIMRCSYGRSGVHMSKHENRSTLSFGNASEVPSSKRRDGSQSGLPPANAEIGFVGLGHMGTAMAENLVSAGQPVIAYVRRTDRIGQLETIGLRATTDIGDLLDCHIVISMLPDDDAVRDVVFGRSDDDLDGLAAGLMPGAIHLSMSTISTAAASLVAAEHGRHGQGYVAAPVFGNPEAAKARQLFIIAAGASADVVRCQPIFDCLGQRTFVVGTDPQDANLMKLLGNMMSATALEMLGEVIAVIRKRRLDPHHFVDIMTSTMFGGRAHKIYGDKIVQQAYAPGFVLPLVLKDVRLALAEAEKAGAPMPSVGVVRDRLITAIARGYGDLDWTALGLIAAEEAGLSPLTPAAAE